MGLRGSHGPTARAPRSDLGYGAAGCRGPRLVWNCKGRHDQHQVGYVAGRFAGPGRVGRGPRARGRGGAGGDSPAGRPRRRGLALRGAIQHGLSAGALERRRGGGRGADAVGAPSTVRQKRLPGRRRAATLAGGARKHHARDLLPRPLAGRLGRHRRELLGGRVLLRSATWRDARGPGGVDRRLGGGLYDRGLDPAVTAGGRPSTRTARR